MLRPDRPEGLTLRRMLPAMLVLGAIITHLASEFFGMGAGADAGIVLSPRHAYLAIAAIACLIFIAIEAKRLLRQTTGPRDLKRQLAICVSQLPLRADWRFYALGGAAQLILGLGTALGEGCFFCGHDFLFGVLGALITATLLALLTRIVTARLPRLAAALAAMLLPVVNVSLSGERPEVSPTFSPRPIFWSLQLANRPPPLLS